MNEKIKLAIVVYKNEICKGELSIVKDLQSSGIVTLNYFINIQYPVFVQKRKRVPKFYLLHERLDSFFYKNKFDYDKRINIMSFFPNIPVIVLKKENIIDAQEEMLKNGGIDFILNLVDFSLYDILLNIPRFGLLSISNKFNLSSDWNRSCYWEVVKKKPEISVEILLINKLEKKETVLYRTFFSPHPISININRENTFNISSLLLNRIIKGVHNSGSQYLEELRNLFDASIEEKNVHEKDPPQSHNALCNLLSVLINYLIKKYKSKKIENWYVLVKKNQEIDTFHLGGKTLKKLVAPRKKLWADPFIVSLDNRHYIFVEEYLFKLNKAHISVITLDNNYKILTNERIIFKSYHLSYPHVFEYNQNFYMVPETGGNNTIELYRCLNMPNKWVFVKNIMENISAKDTTLLQYEGKWWLFTTKVIINKPTLYYNELFLYFSDDLFSSKWVEHPKNPIVSDHKYSRSAGNFFIQNNKLYRPSQDCSGRYGKALNINWIKKLNETEYEEVVIKRMDPDNEQIIKGAHTFNFTSDIIVIDAFN